MKTTIKSKKMKAGIVAATLLILSAIGFVATNVIAEDPLPTGEGDVYIGNVTVYLNATDDPDGSGVAETWYKYTFVDLASGISSSTMWMLYSEPFIVTAPGNYTVSYYSIDNAGNIEETKTTSFSIYADLIAPVTICELSGELKP